MDIKESTLLNEQKIFPKKSDFLSAVLIIVGLIIVFRFVGTSSLSLLSIDTYGIYENLLLATISILLISLYYQIKTLLTAKTSTNYFQLSAVFNIGIIGIPAFMWLIFATSPNIGLGAVAVAAFGGLAFMICAALGFIFIFIGYVKNKQKPVIEIIEVLVLMVISPLLVIGAITSIDLAKKTSENQIKEELSIPGIQDTAPVTHGIYECTDSAILRLYEDPNYQGDCIAFGWQVYDLADYKFNDRISSLKIKKGYSVNLYKNTNYGGASRRFFVDTSYVGDDFNDAISSIGVSE